MYNNLIFNVSSKKTNPFLLLIWIAKSHQYHYYCIQLSYHLVCFVRHDTLIIHSFKYIFMCEFYTYKCSCTPLPYTNQLDIKFMLHHIWLIYWLIIHWKFVWTNYPQWSQSYYIVKLWYRKWIFLLSY